MTEPSSHKQSETAAEEGDVVFEYDPKLDPYHDMTDEEFDEHISKLLDEESEATEAPQ